jgi:hypothetical protein
MTTTGGIVAVTGGRDLGQMVTAGVMIRGRPIQNQPSLETNVYWPNTRIESRSQWLRTHIIVATTHNDIDSAERHLNR